MAVATTMYGGYLPVTFPHSHPKTTCENKPTTTPPPPSSSLYISTNPTHVNPVELRKLYSVCNHSCHRFPKVESSGRVEAIEDNKLRIALSHSSVVVSAFAKLESDSSSSEAVSLTKGIGGFLFQKIMPFTPHNDQLVGFGRGVTDFGLTASVYDVMVNPSFQNSGIGRMIVERIVRVLTRRGVYDIAALCSEEESPFFRACGFGDDILGSTTMIYTRTSSRSSENEQVVSVGRKLLLIPPIREHFKSPSPIHR